MILAGLDEAGYGPTLGPLVLAAVAFRCPDRSRRTPLRPGDAARGGARDLWRLLSPAVVSTTARVGRGPAAVVDDSKRVYSGGQGLDRLETTALAFLALRGGIPRSPRELLDRAGLSPLPDLWDLPWYAAEELSLPLATSAERIEGARAAIAARLRERTVALAGIRLRLVPAAEFNALLSRLPSKGTLLSLEHARLLGWALGLAREGEDTMALGDAHGGRRDYLAVLAEAAGDGLWVPIEGGRGRAAGRGARVATYRGEGPGRRRRAVRFAPGADGEAFPVALASIVAKYTREVWMRLLNRFFASLQPELRATAGYPVDATRFLRDIAPLLRAHPTWEPALRRVR